MAFSSVWQVRRLFLFHFFLILIMISFIHSRANHQVAVTAMYVFGDSEVDVGNNNFLPLTIVKADFPFNGIDFPTKKPTGRFSNGKNAADLIAEKLRLPTSSPPYLSLLRKKDEKSFPTGVNFASGGGGIFNSTGQSLGTVIPLTKQVDQYARVYQKLEKKMGRQQAMQHLSKSIFVVVTGSNDIFNYYESSDMKRSTPQHYVDLMLLAFKGQLQRLHKYGGRKFLIPGPATIGCTPSRRLASKTQECNEDINSLARKYNEGLKSMLQQLKVELNYIYYSYFDTYTALLNILDKPGAHGFKEAKKACCGIGKLKAEIPCIPISTYCTNRSDHVFWDIVHPTEATSRFLVQTLFDGPSHLSFPFNLSRLILL